MILANCKLIFEKIRCYRGQDLLDEYVLRWTAFTASMLNMSKLLSPFASALNEISDEILNISNFKIHDVMNFLWKTEVFEKLQNELIERIFVLFNKVRESDSDQGLNLLIKSMETILDHCLNERNLMFQDHTQLFDVKLYNKIHKKALKCTKIYYDSFDLDVESLVALIEKDVRIVKLVFLPKTQQEIEGLAYEKTRLTISNHLTKEYSNFSNIRPTQFYSRSLDEYLYSQLGLILFRQEPSISKIRAFISTFPNLIPLFQLYNNCIVQNNTLFEAKNQEIEIRARRTGLSNPSKPCKSQDMSPNSSWEEGLAH